LCRKSGRWAYSPVSRKKKAQKEINNTTKTINHRRIYRRNRTHRSQKVTRNYLINISYEKQSCLIAAYFWFPRKPQIVYTCFIHLFPPWNAYYFAVDCIWFDLRLKCCAKTYNCVQNNSSIFLGLRKIHSNDKDIKIFEIRRKIK